MSDALRWRPVDEPHPCRPPNWSVGVAASASRSAPVAASRSSAPTATATRGSRAPSRYRAPPAGERSVSRARAPCRGCARSARTAKPSAAIEARSPARLMSSAVFRMLPGIGLAGIRLASAGGVAATQGTPAGPRIAHSGSQCAGFARNRPESGFSGRARGFRACYESMRIRPIWREIPKRPSSAAARSRPRPDRIRAMAGELRPMYSQLGILPCVPRRQPSPPPASALAAGPLSR